MVRALTAAATAPDLNGAIINVGSGQETSANDLAKKIIKITNSKAEILLTPGNDAGVSRMCADLTLAKKKLSYKAKTSLEDGLAKTLELDERFQDSKT